MATVELTREQSALVIATEILNGRYLDEALSRTLHGKLWREHHAIEPAYYFQVEGRPYLETLSIVTYEGLAAFLGSTGLIQPLVDYFHARFEAAEFHYDPFLQPKNAQALKLRFGWDLNHIMSYREIGRVLGVGSSVAGAWLNDGLDKLRRSSGWKDSIIQINGFEEISPDKWKVRGPG